jgi:hypothetical protein
MEASDGNNMSSPDETHSTKFTSVEEFENKLREENMRLLRKLCIKEMIGRAKSNDPTLWPFK